jgi:hypothetical protein
MISDGFHLIDNIAAAFAGLLAGDHAQFTFSNSPSCCSPAHSLTIPHDLNLLSRLKVKPAFSNLPPAAYSNYFLIDAATVLHVKGARTSDSISGNLQQTI